MLHRGGAAPRREHGEVQVDPAVLGDVEGGPREQRSVSHHRAALRRQLGETREESGIAWAFGHQGLHRGLLGECPHRRVGDLATAAGRSVRAGHHRDDLMAGRVEQRPQARQRGGRGAGEHQPHQRARPNSGCGEVFTVGGACPAHCASRIAFIAAFFVARSSRSMNSTPSR